MLAEVAMLVESAERERRRYGRAPKEHCSDDPCRRERD